jgi:GDPmannose 4,6-dehydratase
MVSALQADEIYNLAAQTHVHTSFSVPQYTSQVNYIGVLHFLEAIRVHSPQSKFYQASTSELFGKVAEIPQSEKTPFHPRSPYGVAKLAAHWLVVNYREAYKLHACCGILFNHESPLRSPEFVTRKVSQGLSQFVTRQRTDPLLLGNLAAIRDWGYAPEFVAGMHQMLQVANPREYVLATGRPANVRDYCTMAAHALGVELDWSGTLDQEQATWKGKTVIKVDPKLYRPAEVDLLVGDPREAEADLGWVAKTTTSDLAAIMAVADLDRARSGCAFNTG